MPGRSRLLLALSANTTSGAALRAAHPCSSARSAVSARHGAAVLPYAARTCQLDHGNCARMSSTGQRVAHGAPWCLGNEVLRVPATPPAMHPAASAARGETGCSAATTTRSTVAASRPTSRARASLRQHTRLASSCAAWRDPWSFHCDRGRRTQHLHGARGNDRATAHTTAAATKTFITDVGW